jgi:hypothetical protein
MRAYLLPFDDVLIDQKPQLGQGLDLTLGHLDCLAGSVTLAIHAHHGSAMGHDGLRYRDLRFRGAGH